MPERPLEDWEYPDPDDEDDEFSETVPCPACGEEVYEAADRCPHCGEYVTPSAASLWSGRPVWFVFLALLGIAALVLALVWGR